MTASILLLVASLALFVLEVLVVSFGALTVVAVACGIGSVLSAFNVSDAMGWTMVGVLVVGGPLSVWGGFKLLPRIPFARGFYLRQGPVSRAERAAAAPQRDELLGATGTALTPLRPAGTVRFGEEPVPVVTTGEMVAKGGQVRVVSVTGNRIVVEPAE